MKVSIIIPVFNEEKTILKVVQRVLKQPFNKEIIIVNDGSSDNTEKKLESLNLPGIIICRHSKNKGKGSAIRTGLGKATGHIIAIQDADLEYDPRELCKLISPIVVNQADVVYGSRFLTTKHPMSIYYVGNRILTYFTRVLFFKKITDMETCYKIFHRKVIKGIKIRSNRFDLEPEITAKILKKGVRFLELPISYTGRTHRQGKKITWKDGIHASIALLRYRLFD